MQGKPPAERRTPPLTWPAGWRIVRLAEVAHERSPEPFIEKRCPPDAWRGRDCAGGFAMVSNGRDPGAGSCTGLLAGIVYRAGSESALELGGAVFCGTAKGAAFVADRPYRTTGNAPPLFSECLHPERGVLCALASRGDSQPGGSSRVEAED